MVRRHVPLTCPEDSPLSQEAWQGHGYKNKKQGQLQF
jgi:hypothetical protein